MLGSVDSLFFILYYFYRTDKLPHFFPYHFHSCSSGEGMRWRSKTLKQTLSLIVSKATVKTSHDQDLKGSIKKLTVKSNLIPLILSLQLKTTVKIGQ